jgi:hypothetical protein
MNATNIYFDVPWSGTTNEGFLEDIKQQTPGSCGEWGDVSAVKDPEKADFHIAFDSPSKVVDPERLLLFCAEPPDRFSRSKWEDIDALRKFWIEDYYKPQRWWVGKSYDELINLQPPEKSNDLSWITSDKGLDINPIYRLVRKLIMRTEYQKYNRKGITSIDGVPYDGHIMRMDFYKRCEEELTDLLHLYGRGDFESPCYRGEVKLKWDGLKDYRYSLAVENSRGPNYFSEKICDALLCWTMPIYWGCTNIGDFLPKDSYIWIDIEDSNAPNTIRKIVQSNLREKNLKAIAKARRRILNQYQIWPTVERVIEGVRNNSTFNFNHKYK